MRTTTPTNHVRHFNTDAMAWEIHEVDAREARTLEPKTGEWYVNPTTGVAARLVYSAQDDMITCETWAPFYPSTATFHMAHGNIGRTPGAKRKAVKAVRAHLARTDWDA